MSKEVIYTGIQYLNIGDEDEVPLTAGLSLIRPNPFLLSGRMRHAQNEHEWEEAEKTGRYLVYRYENFPIIPPEKEVPDPEAMFYGGLMALQIVKPVNTLGFVYRGTDYGGSTIHAAIEHRQPMYAAEWARLRRFDATCLSDALALIPRVQNALRGKDVPKKNAVTLLQLGMEMYAYHQRIAGLLWVMGMEAIFDSGNKNEFSDSLCGLLGPDSPVFPDWAEVTEPYTSTVKEVAIDLYMLRSKLAHGVDLRSAASDKKTPVDLLKIVRLHEYSQDRYYSELLGEAACYLLCRVIRASV